MQKKIRLNIDTIEKEKPTDKERFVWDDKLAGFGLRVMPTGVKSFIIQYRNASGISRRLTLGKYGVLTPDEARRLAKEKLAEVTKGFDPAQAKLEQSKATTVKELCEQYIAASEQGVILGKNGRPRKTSSLYEDKSRIKRHIIPLLGNMKVLDLTSPDIYRFMRDVMAGKTALDERTKKRGRAIVKGGPGIAARTVSTLGGMMTYAIHEGIITHSPTRGVKKPKGKSRKIRLTEQQYGALGEAMTLAFQKGWNRDALNAIILIALTGCRKGEIEKLRWSEVDMKGRCLRLEDTKEGPSVPNSSSKICMRGKMSSLFMPIVGLVIRLFGSILGSILDHLSFTLSITSTTLLPTMPSLGFPFEALIFFAQRKSNTSTSSNGVSSRLRDDPLSIVCHLSLNNSIAAEV